MPARRKNRTHHASQARRIVSGRPTTSNAWSAPPAQAAAETLAALEPHRLGDDGGRREAGKRGQDLGTDSLTGVLDRLHLVADPEQPLDRVGHPDR